MIGGPKGLVHFGGPTMISFKGAQFPREVILFAVFFYVRYTESYRDLDDRARERHRFE
jgi:transposase-like protein